MAQLMNKSVYSSTEMKKEAGLMNKSIYSSSEAEKCPHLMNINQKLFQKLILEKAIKAFSEVNHPYT